jgi:hypothetical protein
MLEYPDLYFSWHENFKSIYFQIYKKSDFHLLVITTMLGVSFVTMACRVLRLRMEGSLPGTEDSCEYIEKAVADTTQVVALQLGVRRGAATPHLKIFLLRNVSKRHGARLILCHELSNGKGLEIWYLES